MLAQRNLAMAVRWQIDISHPSQPRHAKLLASRQIFAFSQPADKLARCFRGKLLQYYLITSRVTQRKLAPLVKVAHIFPMRRN